MRNIEMTCVINAKGICAGMTYMVVGEVPDGHFPCDGRELLKAAYPELFNVIGRQYSQPENVFERIKPKWWQRLLLIDPGTQMVPNPLFDKDRFALPDLRGHFLKGEVK